MVTLRRVLLAMIVSTNVQLLYWSCEYYEILNTYHP